MTKDSKIKEWLFALKKQTTAALQKQSRVLKRMKLPEQVVTPENCFDIPIIINNRNRYTFLKMMIDQLTGFGYRNIYVLDNDSTYPPLLEYYRRIPANVIFLKANVGYKALWETNVFEQFKNGFYVYSDPDILMQEDCPKDFVYHLYQYLMKYSGKEKAGVALKIDDLPFHYNHREEAIKNERVFWEKELEPNVYDEPVDTPLAL